MERGSKRLKAEEKGKAVMPEQKENTLNEKDAEAALNISHAGDLQERGTEQIRDSTPPATQTPIEDGNNFCELASRMSRSVVTVAALSDIGKPENTSYGTGFILTSQENYALVLTYIRHEKDRARQYFVYFEGSCDRNNAYVLQSSLVNNFMILIIKTQREYAPVVFSDAPLGRELVFTVGSTGGAKYNANGKLIDPLVGSVVTYRGKVAVSAYAASDLKFNHVDNSEQFFEVTCCVHDDIISSTNVDKKKVRMTTTVLCAPVFCFDGTVGGIIFSPGNWGDVKCGLHAKTVVSRIQSMCGTKPWREYLKEAADHWLVGHP